MGPAPSCRLWSQEHLEAGALLRKPDQGWDIDVVVDQVFLFSLVIPQCCISQKDLHVPAHQWYPHWSGFLSKRTPSHQSPRDDHRPIAPVSSNVWKFFLIYLKISPNIYQYLIQKLGGQVEVEFSIDVDFPLSDKIIFGPGPHFFICVHIPNCSDALDVGNGEAEIVPKEWDSLHRPSSKIFHTYGHL